MDFFQRQDEARAKTKWLIVYFVVAVLCIIGAVYLAALILFFGTGAETGLDTSGFGWWDPSVFLAVASVTLAIIVSGSLYKIHALSEGGEVVGRLLGGRPLSPTSSNLAERKILNVVEEMALASGIAVPTVFLLEKEEGINAFAAGFTPSDAIIGVTRGCLELLSRDELQGVIAHEFSHIVNGDMRLNLRLMGVLHGILVIALIGYTILRFGPRGGNSSSRDNKKSDGSAILLFGLALLVIGYIGVLFGHLIKSAVSRQREFLADAAAVQFTRNPDGIAGALKKIGGFLRGSLISSPKAEEASHLFFSNGLRSSFVELLATHPPLEERIRRIDPSFDGNFPKVALKEAAHEKVGGKKTSANSMAEMLSGGALPLPLRIDDPAQFTAQVGMISDEHVQYARSLIDQVPEPLVQALREPATARSVVWAILLDSDSGVESRQRLLLQEGLASADYDGFQRAVEVIRGLPAALRLPLIDMSLPALRQLSPPQYQEFEGLVQKLIEADNRVSFFEYALTRVLLRHLGPYFGKTRQAPVNFTSLRKLGPHCSILLSRLAYEGHKDIQQVADAFKAAAAELEGTGARVELVPENRCAVRELDAALEKLAEASGELKRHVLRACAACVGYDGRLEVLEGELLRAVADALDCPVPPLMNFSRA